MRGAEEGLLLLCCKLGQPVKPLTPTEYRQMESYVAAMTLTRPKGDLGRITPQHLASLGYTEEMSKRILSLLERPRALHDYLGAHKDISVLTRLSEQFPQRLRRLGLDCPAALFCKGDPALLGNRCIAAVGSRMLFERGSRFAREIGRLAAKGGFTLVSGNAAGADSIAQEACLQAGGSVICFVPDELTRYDAKGKNILYCSAYGYDLPFSNARALYRNLLIHALGEKTFVAQCPSTFGGTWAGTSENLKRGLSDVYVLNDGSDGANALCARGAIPVEEPLPPISDLLSYQLSIFD